MFTKTNEPICPFLNKPCLKQKCMLWTEIEGTNPQTGDPIKHGDCAIKVQTLLAIETNKNLTGIQAAQESTRNETAKVAGIIGYRVAMIEGN